MDELHQRVVDHIRAKAEAIKIPVSHLPDRAGVSRSHFWQVLSGEKSPTLRWLGRIAEALSADVEELLQRPEKPAKKKTEPARKRR